MSFQFTTTRSVEFYETDLAGIVHFSNFYRYMEEAEHQFLRTLGLRVINPQEDGSTISWPRVSATCSFQAPAYYEDELEIRLRISRKGVKSLTYEIEFWRDEERIAHGRVKTVCCRFVPGQPLESIPIPEEYGRLLQEADAEE